MMPAVAPIHVATVSPLAASEIVASIVLSPSSASTIAKRSTRRHPPPLGRSRLFRGAGIGVAGAQGGEPDNDEYERCGDVYGSGGKGGTGDGADQYRYRADCDVADNDAGRD